MLISVLAEGLSLQQDMERKIQGVKLANEKIKESFMGLQEIGSHRFQQDEIMVEPLPCRNHYHERDRNKEEMEMVIAEMKNVIEFYKTVVQECNKEIETSEDDGRKHHLIAYKVRKENELELWDKMFSPYLRLRPS